MELHTRDLTSVGMKVRFDRSQWQEVRPPSPAALLVLANTPGGGYPTLTIVLEPAGDSLPLSELSRWRERLLRSYAGVGLSGLQIASLKTFKLQGAVAALRATVHFAKGDTAYLAEVLTLYRGENLVHITEVFRAGGAQDTESAFSNFLDGLEFSDAYRALRTNTMTSPALPSLPFLIFACSLPLLGIAAIVFFLRARKSR
ncbi:MAG: hypothetical protein KDD64_03205 [Bdellovibrionales bacterium]|nr:hypothetical protein [Bdellovibrionales bacterium]